MPNLTEKSKAWHSVYAKKWHTKNRKRRIREMRSYYWKNRKALLRYAKKNRAKYRVWKRAWRIKNLEHARAYARRHYRQNRKQLIAAAVEYRRKRLRRDPLARLSIALRSRVYAAIKNNTLKSRVSEIFGCSPVQLRAHLQSKFTAGMTWENFGKTGWEIDHVKPCCLFDFSKISHQRKCFHYTNLQPLWKLDNRRKHRKYLKIA